LYRHHHVLPKYLLLDNSKTIVMLLMEFNWHGDVLRDFFPAAVGALIWEFVLPPQLIAKRNLPL
jgi:hypothetical protein